MPCRLKALVAALKADDRYEEQDHVLIDQALGGARATLMVGTVPVLIPVALSSLAVTGIHRRLRSAERWSPLEALEFMRFRDHELRHLDDLTNSRRAVRTDPRFRRLSELAFEMALNAYSSRIDELH
jgi:hypothetical protein